MGKTLLTCSLCVGLSLAGAACADIIHKVGKVTWHAVTYQGRPVALVGYLLASKDGYVLFSDEPRGAISAHDLPVTGAGYDTMKAGQKYLLHGIFVKGARYGNGNLYHLELTSPPEAYPRR